MVLIHTPTGKRKELKGSVPMTTNNRMELTAAIKALSALKRQATVAVYSDSQYLVRGMNEWIKIWEQRGFQNVKKEELFKELISLNQRHFVSFKKVSRLHPLLEKAHLLAKNLERGRNGKAN